MAEAGAGEGVHHLGPRFRKVLPPFEMQRQDGRPRKGPGGGDGLDGGERQVRRPDRLHARGAEKEHRGRHGEAAADFLDAVVPDRVARYVDNAQRAGKRQHEADDRAAVPALRAVPRRRGGNGHPAAVWRDEFG